VVLSAILLLVAYGHHNCIKHTKVDVRLRTPDDGQKGCPKHVQEFSASVGFIHKEGRSHFIWNFGTLHLISMNMEAAHYCEMLVTIYPTILKKAEPSLSKMLASTVRLQPSVTFANAALRRRSQYQPIELHIATFLEVWIFHFRGRTNRKSSFTHRSSANLHYLFPLSQRLETSVFVKIIADLTNHDVLPCIMTLPTSIISVNKIVISKEYFIKRKLIGFLEHRV